MTFPQRRWLVAGVLSLGAYAAVWLAGEPSGMDSPDVGERLGLMGMVGVLPMVVAAAAAAGHGEHILYKWWHSRKQRS